MKLQSTIVLTLHAATLADAGETLDDVLARARERADVEVTSLEVHTPIGSAPVTLPHPAPPVAQPERLPRPLPA